MRNIVILYFILLSITSLLSSCSDTGSRGTGPLMVKMDVQDGGVADGATGVSLSPLLILRFSHPVNPMTVNSKTITLSTDKIAYQQINIPLSSFIANKENTVFSFHPKISLMVNTKYYLILSGVKIANSVIIINSQFSFTTGISDVPTVGLISPTNNQVTTSTLPNIEIEFSQPVSGVSSKTVSLHENMQNGQQVAIGNMVANNSNTIFTFSPVRNLKSFTTYYIVIGNGIKSTINAAEVKPVNSFHFITGNLDNPEVILINPANNQSDVDLIPIIEIGFSQPVTGVDNTTISLHENSLNKEQIIIGNIIANNSKTLFVFSPVNNLKSFTTYYISIGSGIKSAINGRGVKPTDNLYFTTGDLNNPEVILINPANNQLNVGLQPNIEMVFSTAVKGVDSTTVHLYDGVPESSGILVDVTSPKAIDNTNTVFTFGPKGLLNESSVYNVVIESSISALSNGKNLAQNETSDFITVASIITVLYSFSGNDGTFPNQLMQASDGNLYGLTFTNMSCSENDRERLFRYNLNTQQETTLYTFSGSEDGRCPVSLSQGSDGDLYGATIFGGVYNAGILFSYNLDAGNKITLYSFGSRGDGAYPDGDVIQGIDGNLYGTTSGGGRYYRGTVFSYNLNNQGEKVIHSFGNGTDGAYPISHLIESSDGVLYGITERGGVYNKNPYRGYGTVFKVSLDGTESVLYSFSNTNGDDPNNLIKGNNNDFYGTTYFGGRYQSGTIFTVIPDVISNSLYSFLGKNGDGGAPSSLLMLTNGMLYGTTEWGGSGDDCGTIFTYNLTTQKESVIHSFQSNEYYRGCVPFSMISAKDGNLYGTTGYGGVYGSGTIFMVNLR